MLLDLVDFVVVSFLFFFSQLHALFGTANISVKLSMYSQIKQFASGVSTTSVFMYINQYKTLMYNHQYNIRAAHTVEMRDPV